MRRLIWPVLTLSLAACGGSNPSTTLSVTCAGGVQLFGASSIDVQGDLADGRPAMQFPDPVNAGKIGTITIPPHDHCKITPGSSG